MQSFRGNKKKKQYQSIAITWNMQAELVNVQYFDHQRLRHKNNKHVLPLSFFKFRVLKMFNQKLSL